MGSLGWKKFVNGERQLEEPMLGLRSHLRYSELIEFNL